MLLKRTALTALALVFVFAITSDPHADTLVVLNKVGGTAWLIDPETGESRARLTVGQGPHEAAVSPDGRTAVVCNYGAQRAGNTLSVIDVAAGELLDTIDLSPHARPHGIRYVDEHRLLVTSEVTRSLILVDVLEGKIAATYDAGADIHMVDVSPDGRYAYATAMGAGLLTRIDLEAPDAAPRTLATGRGTEALAIRPDGSEIWIGNNDEQLVRVVDAETFGVVADISCGVQPIRIAFTGDGARALVTCLLSGELAVIDADRRTIERTVPLGDFVTPIAMWEEQSEAEQRILLEKVVADGPRPIGVLPAPGGESIFVANRGLDHIAVIDASTWRVVRRLATGSGPDGMAWSPLGGRIQSKRGY